MEDSGLRTRGSKTESNRTCRIVFFDVFNRIHRLDENDNTQMAAVTARLSQFAAEVGCQVGLVHHLNKDYGNGKIFNRLRGAGALHGWMEWGIAITVVNPEDEKDEWIRRIEFESKEASTLGPILLSHRRQQRSLPHRS